MLDRFVLEGCSVPVLEGDGVGVDGVLRRDGLVLLDVRVVALPPREVPARAVVWVGGWYGVLALDDFL